MVSRTSAAKQPQLNIMGYYTQSAAIRAARGDSIATPAVSLEHGRGRLKDRSQGRRPAMRDRDSLESAAASNPDRPNPLDQRPANPPGPPTTGPPRYTGSKTLRAAFRESVSHNFALNFSGGSRNNLFASRLVV